MTRILVFAFLSAISVGFCSRIAPAQNRDTRGYPAPVDRSASAKARKDVGDAELQLHKATDEFKNIGAVLRKDLENSTEWKTAQSALKQAQAEFDTARTAVLLSLKDKPEYTAAARAKQDAEAARDAISDPPGSVNQVNAAKAVLDAGKKVTEIESVAINADAAASSARAVLSDAAGRVAEINKRFEDTLKKDPKYKAADKAVDDASRKLAQSKAALISAQQKEAQAERGRQRRIDEIERRRDQEARRRAQDAARRLRR